MDERIRADWAAHARRVQRRNERERMKMQARARREVAAILAQVPGLVDEVREGWSDLGWLPDDG